MIGRVLGPRRPNKVQRSTYECGIETVGEGQEQLKVQYYLVRPRLPGLRC
ncbi:MAG: NADH-quinone oxidoreductase subunit A [Anaerolineae bacterium]|nr:NADH-quinone oxidoreductase subunit A [Anaerolineae bacterium]